jgi:hypothetical protein
MDESCAPNRDGSAANKMEKAQIKRQAALALKGLTERRLTDVAACKEMHS